MAGLQTSSKPNIFALVFAAIVSSAQSSAQTTPPLVFDKPVFAAREANTEYSHVEIPYAHDGCSFLYSPVDFCDEIHIAVYRNALYRQDVNFAQQYILLSIPERDLYYQRSLVVLDPATGIAYPFPFDAYSGPIDSKGKISKEGTLHFSVNDNNVCIDGSLLVYRAIEAGRFCFSFKDGRFSGYETQYMYEKTQ